MKNQEMKNANKNEKDRCKRVMSISGRENKNCVVGTLAIQISHSQTPLKLGLGHKTSLRQEI
jgi:hypothetical protein